MNLFLLTTEQKTLLRAIIGFIEDGKLKEPIVPYPAGSDSSHFVLHLHGANSFQFKRVADLNHLCDVGLLRYRWNRQGNGRLYYVTKAGATAVANDFKSPAAPFGQEISLAMLVATLSSGAITLDGIKDSKTVREIAGDPVLRHTAVTHLISSLQTIVEGQLPWAQFRTYYEQCQTLQTEMLVPRPNASTLQELFTQLAAPQGHLTTWPQIWAHLYPLLLIVQTRLDKSPLPKG